MFHNSTGEQLRLKVGSLVYDVPSFLWHLRPTGGSQWARICNRNERLIVDSANRGVLCDWQWTSDLHIAKVFPRLGHRLMRRALSTWPIRLRSAPPTLKESIKVSFIIGHRGSARVPHLMATLSTIAAQVDVSCECIVVEQSNKPEIETLLPSWVRYVHTPLPYNDMPYSRSWTFNVGAELARGSLLILQDNDMLVPADYASQHFARIREGYEVINLKRFIFFLSRRHTDRLLSNNKSLLDEAPDSIMQNAEGGGSLAITRDAYFAVGGFDESFIGWGGEDNEFWERAQTRQVWPYGYLPLVHLWHESQPGKGDPKRRTAELLEQRSSIPAAKRIEELRERNFQVNLSGVHN